MTKINKVKQKKCRQCKCKFTPFNSLQVVCGVKCAALHAKLKREEKEKKEHAAKKKKLKTARDYINEAQSSVNRYIRARDADKLCASCDCMLSNQLSFDAGHYRSRGAASHLRFNLLNIWGQCKRCNRHLGGNYSEYRKILVKRIGVDLVEKLESDNGNKKFTIEYLERVKKIFNKKARFYERKKNG